MSRRGGFPSENIEEKIVKSALYGRVMHFYFSCKKNSKSENNEKNIFLHLRSYSLLLEEKYYFIPFII